MLINNNNNNNFISKAGYFYFHFCFFKDFCFLPLGHFNIYQNRGYLINETTTTTTNLLTYVIQQQQFALQVS